MKKKNRIIFIILCLFSAIQIFPLLWLINFSLKSNSEIYTTSSLKLPETPMFSNYVQAWVDGNLAKYFGNSVFVTGVSVVLTLILGCTMGYAITRMVWKGGKLVMNMLMIGMMIPIHVTLIPLFLILQKVGLLSTHAGLILAYIAVGLPLSVFIISNFLRTVPRDLEEAAVIDGCNVYRLLLYVVLPILKPALATVGIFIFMSNWNEFIMSSTYMQSADLYTLPMALVAFKGRHTTALGPMMATTVITCAPLIVFYALCSEQVEKSFAAGAGLK